MAKEYVGSGKEFGQYGAINIGIRFADLPAPNEKGYINLVVSKRKEPDKFGNTHSVAINDYKATKREDVSPEPNKHDDGLPF